MLSDLILLHYVTDLWRLWCIFRTSLWVCLHCVYGRVRTWKCVSHVSLCLVTFEVHPTLSWMQHAALYVSNIWKMFCSVAHTNLMGREDSGSSAADVRRLLYTLWLCSLISKWGTASDSLPERLPVKPQASQQKAIQHTGQSGGRTLVCLHQHERCKTHSPQSLLSVQFPVFGPQVLISSPITHKTLVYQHVDTCWYITSAFVLYNPSSLSSVAFIFAIRNKFHINVP